MKLSKFLLTLGLIILILGLAGSFGCQNLNRRESGSVEDQKLLTAIEQKVFEQINNYRTSKGLKPLVIDERIITKAREHSRNMANGKTPFGHEGFESRAAATGIRFQSAAENVAWNQGYDDPATNVVNGWIKSEGHRKNIEGNFNLTGIGVIKNEQSKYYFTQIFMLTNETGNVSVKNQTPSNQNDPQKQGGQSLWDWIKSRF